MPRVLAPRAMTPVVLMLALAALSASPASAAGTRRSLPDRAGTSSSAAPHQSELRGDGAP